MKYRFFAFILMLSVFFLPINCLAKCYTEFKVTYHVQGDKENIAKVRIIEEKGQRYFVVGDGLNGEKFKNVTCWREKNNYYSVGSKYFLCNNSKNSIEFHSYKEKEEKKEEEKEPEEEIKEEKKEEEKEPEEEIKEEEKEEEKEPEEEIKEEEKEEEKEPEEEIKEEEKEEEEEPEEEIKEEENEEEKEPEEEIKEEENEEEEEPEEEIKDEDKTSRNRRRRKIFSGVEEATPAPPAAEIEDDEPELDNELGDEFSKNNEPDEEPAREEIEVISPTVIDGMVDEEELITILPAATEILDAGDDVVFPNTGDDIMVFEFMFIVSAVGVLATTKSVLER